MNWKTEIQLLDLADNCKLEVTCKKCGHSRYENKYLLITKYGLDFQYMDEVERLLSCHQRGCDGDVRLALSAQDETEGFVGGLA
jgi:hypothetical protein